MMPQARISSADIQKYVNVTKNLANLMEHMAKLTKSEADNNAVATLKSLVGQLEGVVTQEWFVDLANTVFDFFDKNENPAEVVGQFKVMMAQARTE